MEFAACHDVANAPDWAGYVNAQGGPLVKRDDLAVRNWYQPAEVMNQYGEEVLSIRGLFDTVVGEDSPILTPLKQWKIVPKLAVDLSDASASPRSSVTLYGGARAAAIKLAHDATLTAARGGLARPRGENLSLCSRKRPGPESCGRPVFG